MNIDVKKILDQAKDSYDRYFKDAPKLPENPGQNVVFDKEKMKEIINKKVNKQKNLMIATFKMHQFFQKIMNKM